MTARVTGKMRVQLPAGGRMSQTDDKTALISAPDAGLTADEGAVTLPRERQIATSGPEFEELAACHLPADVRTPAIEFTRPAGRSQWTALGAVIFVALSVLLLYWLLPAPAQIESLRSLPLDNTLKKLSLAPVNAQLFKDAESLRTQKKFDGCVNLLSPFVITADDAALAQNTRLAFVYLDALYQSTVDASEFRRGYFFAGRLTQLEPDDKNWRLWRWVLTPEVFDYAKIWTQLAQNTLHPAEVTTLRRQADRALDDFAALAKKMGDDLPQTVCANLQLRRAALLTTVWVLDGYPGYPDNTPEDRGVAAREEAYRLAELYPNYETSLKTRLFIVQKLLATSTGNLNFANFYYWRGHKLFRTKYLEDERQTLERELANWEKNRK